MKNAATLALVLWFGTLVASPAFAQAQQHKEIRRPPLSADVASQPTPAPAPSGEFYSMLNGTPVILQIHHDTEVGTDNPIDVYRLGLEMQIMNSDGDLEPVGLWVFNFFTAKAQDPKNAINPHNGHDCQNWFILTLDALHTRNKKSKQWPYMQFAVAEGARMVQTNEDGPVWWSDDIQCWGSRDRFPPF